MPCLVKGIGSPVIHIKASMYHIVNKKARVHILDDILWLNVFLLNASIIQQFYTFSSESQYKSPKPTLLYLRIHIYVH